jgi:hypothetical protein
MLARRIAASAFAAVLAAPAAAHAGHVVRHASEGPSATPLLVELAAAALIAVIAVTRKPLARFARATSARLAQRRADRRLARPARFSGR